MARSNSQPHVDKLVTVAAVAETFGVKSATVRVWLNDGTLKGVKIGKGHYWRIYESDVKALAQAKYGDDNE